MAALGYARAQELTLTSPHRWVVTFVYALLRGFGFASGVIMGLARAGILYTKPSLVAFAS